MSLPEITWKGVAVAAAVLVGSVLLGQVVRMAFGRALRWRGRSEESAQVFGRLLGWVVVALGIGVALTVLFPSVRPVNILGGVGIISIAAGIAFQTVLGNLFAGIIILARDRIQVGDQIALLEQAGTVVEMRLSSTSVRTFDGRLVLVPNGVLHSNLVTVQTGYEHVRSSITIELADDDDLARAQDLAVGTMRALPQVLDEPSPEAFFTAVGTKAVVLELRFWSGARQLETKEATDAVIQAVLGAFADAGIETTSDAVTVDAGPRLQRTLRETFGEQGPA
ncbi:mechanosensitive ion channel family protein [Serinicoccus marinus]|uniref:mechanosensitive ion channel family protein n=2 Tax=Serinicoccus marinus TaxID=247333 RepID=UPI0003B4201B|nr:mechanosensitive ion channel domain-containing protein [Serinicoccus marinus]